MLEIEYLPIKKQKKNLLANSKDWCYRTAINSWPNVPCLWLRWCWESTFQTVTFYRGFSVLVKLVSESPVCVAAANLAHHGLVAWPNKTGSGQIFLFLLCREIMLLWKSSSSELLWAGWGKCLKQIKGSLSPGLLGNCQATWWQSICVQETVLLNIPLFVSKQIVTEMNLDTSSTLMLKKFLGK